MTTERSVLKHKEKRLQLIINKNRFIVKIYAHAVDSNEHFTLSYTIKLPAEWMHPGQVAS